MVSPVRLGVNIDHVATVRNARGGTHPDPVRAAREALAAGADGITAHLREDRRHITDTDIEALSELCAVAGRPLNLEMAVTDEMLTIALRHRPHAACLVPERREEVTRRAGWPSPATRPASPRWPGRCPTPACASPCSSSPRSNRSRPPMPSGPRWSSSIPADTAM